MWRTPDEWAAAVARHDATTITTPEPEAIAAYAEYRRQKEQQQERLVALAAALRHPERPSSLSAAQQHQLGVEQATAEREIEALQEEYHLLVREIEQGLDRLAAALPLHRTQELHNNNNNSSSNGQSAPAGTGEM
jgi:phosphoenolpyruvate carboxylase